MFYTVEKRRESLIVLNDNFTKVLGEYNDPLLGIRSISKKSMSKMFLDALIQRKKR